MPIYLLYIYINEIYKYIISPKKCKAYPPFRMLFPPFLWPTPNWPQPMSPRNNQQPQHLRRSRRGSVVDPHVGHWVWAAKLEKRLFFCIFYNLRQAGMLLSAKGELWGFKSKASMLQLNPMYLVSRSCRSNWWLNLHHLDPFCMETMAILDDHSANHNMPPAGNFCRPPGGKRFAMHMCQVMCGRRMNENKISR